MCLSHEVLIEIAKQIEAKPVDVVNRVQVRRGALIYIVPRDRVGPGDEIVPWPARVERARKACL